MSKEFVQVDDTKKKVQIIQIRQIVRMHQTDDANWQVVLTAGDPVKLGTDEADKLFKSMPGVKVSKLAVG